MKIETEVIDFLNFIKYYNEYYSSLSFEQLNEIEKALEFLDEGQVVNMVSRFKLIEQTFLEIDQMIDQAVKASTQVNIEEKVE